MKHLLIISLLLAPLTWSAGSVEGKKRTGDGADNVRYDGGGSGKVPGTWRKITAGKTFWMGSPTNEPCREQAGGTPLYKETRHQVTLTRNYELQNTEVTQAQFQAVMGYNPSEFPVGGALNPVEKITWHEAKAYCNALSKIRGLSLCYTCAGSKIGTACTDAPAYRAAGGGKPIQSCPGYRLPTEAEWEHAYRAGTNTSLYTKGTVTKCGKYDTAANAVGWYLSNRNKPVGTMQVGLKAANPWGLFDLGGERQRVDLGRADQRPGLGQGHRPGQDQRQPRGQGRCQCPSRGRLAQRPGGAAGSRQERLPGQRSQQRHRLPAGSHPLGRRTGIPPVVRLALEITDVVAHRLRATSMCSLRA